MSLVVKNGSKICPKFSDGIPHPVSLTRRHTPGPTTVSGNAMTRAGSYEYNWGSSLGALWIYANQSDITQPVTVSNNTITNATYDALLLGDSKQIANLTVDHLAISGAGGYGINIKNLTGGMTANYVTVTGAASGGLNNPSNYPITRGPGDSGW